MTKHMFKSAKGNKKASPEPPSFRKRPRAAPTADSAPVDHWGGGADDDLAPVGPQKRKWRSFKGHSRPSQIFDPPYEADASSQRPEHVIEGVFTLEKYCPQERAPHSTPLKVTQPIERALRADLATANAPSRPVAVATSSRPVSTSGSLHLPSFEESTRLKPLPAHHPLKVLFAAKVRTKTERRIQRLAYQSLLSQEQQDNPANNDIQGFHDEEHETDLALAELQARILRAEPGLPTNLLDLADESERGTGQGSRATSSRSRADPNRGSHSHGRARGQILQGETTVRRPPLHKDIHGQLHEKSRGRNARVSTEKPMHWSKERKDDGVAKSHRDAGIKPQHRVQSGPGRLAAGGHEGLFVSDDDQPARLPTTNQESLFISDDEGDAIRSVGSLGNSPPHATNKLLATVDPGHASTQETPSGRGQPLRINNNIVIPRFRVFPRWTPAQEEEFRQAEQQREMERENTSMPWTPAQDHMPVAYVLGERPSRVAAALPADRHQQLSSGPVPMSRLLADLGSQAWEGCSRSTFSRALEGGHVPAPVVATPRPSPRTMDGSGIRAQASPATDLPGPSLFPRILPGPPPAPRPAFAVLAASTERLPLQTMPSVANDEQEMVMGPRATRTSSGDAHVEWIRGWVAETYNLRTGTDAADDRETSAGKPVVAVAAGQTRAQCAVVSSRGGFASLSELQAQQQQQQDLRRRPVPWAFAAEAARDVMSRSARPASKDSSSVSGSLSRSHSPPRVLLPSNDNRRTAPCPVLPPTGPRPRCRQPFALSVSLSAALERLSLSDAHEQQPAKSSVSQQQQPAVRLPSTSFSRSRSPLPLAGDGPIRVSVEQRLGGRLGSVEAAQTVRRGSRGVKRKRASDFF